MNSQLKEKIKKVLKKFPALYNFVIFLVIPEARVRFILRRIVRWPQLHVNYLRKRSTLCGYGVYPRTKEMNLKKPQLFDDKLLWLKYFRYNSSDLVAQCYDKYLVRDYVKSCGLNYILNEIYGVWENVNDIEWSALPEEYVLKKTNGYGEHVFKYAGQPINQEKVIQELKASERERNKIFRATGDLFAVKNKQMYVCEKMLHSETGFIKPEDYKFYCFNGEPKYLLYIWNRQQSSYYKETFKDVTLADRSELFFGAENVEIDRPSCYDEMLEICRKLSKPFPFVRVDLYVQDGRPIFGELTFTPAGSQVLYHVFKKDYSINYDALNEMGGVLQIDNQAQ